MSKFSFIGVYVYSISFQCVIINGMILTDRCFCCVQLQFVVIDRAVSISRAG